MEDTKFSDLKVKVGYPYLYCHQGDCEHLVLITDIRSVCAVVTGTRPELKMFSTFSLVGGVGF